MQASTVRFVFKVFTAPVYFVGFLVALWCAAHWPIATGAVGLVAMVGSALLASRVDKDAEVVGYELLVIPGVLGACLAIACVISLVTGNGDDAPAVTDQPPAQPSAFAIAADGFARGLAAGADLDDEYDEDYVEPEAMRGPLAAPPGSPDPLVWYAQAEVGAGERPASYPAIDAPFPSAMPGDVSPYLQAALLGPESARAAWVASLTGADGEEQIVELLGLLPGFPHPVCEGLQTRLPASLDGPMREAAVEMLAYCWPVPPPPRESVACLADRTRRDDHYDCLFDLAWTDRAAAVRAVTSMSADERLDIGPLASDLLREPDVAPSLSAARRIAGERPLAMGGAGVISDVRTALVAMGAGRVFRVPATAEDDYPSLLYALAGVSGEALAGAVFTTEADDRGTVVRAYHGGRTFAVSMQRSAPWFDFEGSVALVNTMLQTSESPLRAVVSDGGDGAAYVLIGVESELRAAHQSGTLPLVGG